VVFKVWSWGDANNFSSYEINLLHGITCTQGDQIKRIGLAGHVARMKTIRNAYKYWTENLKGRDNSEDLGIDERLILEWILGK
jgi:hypothetical protein